MAYETRGGRRYYYLARRVDGRVVKKYLGDGAEARQAAANVAQRQRDLAAQRRREADFKDQLLIRGAEFEQFWEASERALRLAFSAANYHCRRGEWRRRRES